MTSSDLWSRRLASGWIYWPACLAGLFFLGVAVLGPEVQRRLGVGRQCGAMQAEVDALRQTRDQLAAAERALETDPAYTERVVRHELGIVRPGEMYLPQPVRLSTLRKEVPPPSAPLVPPAVELLARYGNPWLRFVAMVIGGTLLAVAILFSLPGRSPQTQQTRAE